MKTKIVVLMMCGMVLCGAAQASIAYIGLDDSYITTGSNWEGGAVPSIANGLVGIVTDQAVWTPQYVAMGTVVFDGSTDLSRNVADNLRLRNANWTFQGTSTLTLTGKRLYSAQDGGDINTPVVVNWDSSGTLAANELYNGVSAPGTEFNQSAGLVALTSKMFLYDTGVYNLSGGTLSVVNNFVNNKVGALNFDTATSGTGGTISMPTGKTAYFQGLIDNGTIVIDTVAQTPGDYSNFNIVDDAATTTISVVPVAGRATYPDPGNGDTDIETDLLDGSVPGAVLWQSPDDPDDPNIVQVFGYNVYLDPNETDVTNATTATTVLQHKSLYVLGGTGQTGDSFDPGTDLDPETTYYWRVDPIVDFDTVTGTADNDANTVTGAIWSFTTAPDDFPIEEVDAGDSSVATLQQVIDDGVLLDGFVDDDGVYSVLWEAFLDDGVTSADANVVITDPTSDVTFVTSIDAAGDYILKITATDAVGSASDTLTIKAFDTVCEASIAGRPLGNGWNRQYADFDWNCTVDLEDFVRVARAWVVLNVYDEVWYYTD